jgi:hypothetical protein
LNSGLCIARQLLYLHTSNPFALVIFQTGSHLSLRPTSGYVHPIYTYHIAEITGVPRHTRLMIATGSC